MHLAVTVEWLSVRAEQEGSVFGGLAFSSMTGRGRRRFGGEGCGCVRAMSGLVDFEHGTAR